MRLRIIFVTPPIDIAAHSRHIDHSIDYIEETAMNELPAACIRMESADTFLLKTPEPFERDFQEALHERIISVKTRYDEKLMLLVDAFRISFLETNEATLDMMLQRSYLRVISSHQA